MDGLGLDSGRRCFRCTSTQQRHTRVLSRRRRSHSTGGRIQRPKQAKTGQNHRDKWHKGTVSGGRQVLAQGRWGAGAQPCHGHVTSTGLERLNASMDVGAGCIDSLGRRVGRKEKPQPAQVLCLLAGDDPTPQPVRRSVLLSAASVLCAIVT